MVEFKNITYNYSSKSGIYNIDLNIQDDEFCFLVGPTGSGKSTLLKLLYFDLLPDKGSVNVLGYSSKKIKKKDIYRTRKKIGVIFQDYKLLKQRTVYENIALPLHINGFGRKKIANLVSEALELTELSRYAKKFPHQLSGGEQQRVCIARAIVKNPDIILADEPTGNLDPTAGHRILRILEQINKEGTCVIMATHNYKLIAEKPYRVIELDQGRVVSE
ncbi:MAG: ATP-binding cassette domain-containing protein [Candidatus Marinimicrobia bacterium]|jgi:cell division transport system ATP-binding protein|nr:ATP-binding cassette domain-containing protein [Gammaproteobacteria bacterium]MBL6911773.1 ATP-binding cassette domain-containing protein [Candidatus Neomarinimicrobiota bacterium]MBT3728188.1 ATP-binding cassette domain-containing protein [Candidatus Neomarinimicrobiota bacterium]MBT3944083.1 ATP-binding cassette domain-containing protein [Candidatus Neomarinimicrobiota bacterium]MBT4112058.1 ATP-binding cassette domain-containing protein [Candidatus Neomarinimicrobiota bacterium]